MRELEFQFNSTIPHDNPNLQVFLKGSASHSRKEMNEPSQDRRIRALQAALQKEKDDHHQTMKLQIDIQN